jgi:hypothetical protein
MELLARREKSLKDPIAVLPGAFRERCERHLSEKLAGHDLAQAPPGEWCSGWQSPRWPETLPANAIQSAAAHSALGSARLRTPH